MANKKEQIYKIRREVEQIHVWECPCCAAKLFGDGCQTTNEFLEYLYKSGVRFKIMKYMQGVFCKECYSDPEIQNSSL